MGENTIYPVVVEFFDAYMIERNIQKTLSLCAEDVYSIGTGEEEAAIGKEEFASLLRKEIASIPQPIKYRIIEYREKKCSEKCWQCFCRMETTVSGTEECTAYYRTRLTASFQKAGGRYLAASLHMSEASHTQEEEEFFPLRFIAQNEKKLSRKAQSELLDMLCQLMPGGIIGGYIEEGFPLYVINNTMLDMMGYSYEEFVEACGGLVANSFHEDDAERVTQEVLKRMRTGKEYTIEYRVKRRDGGYIWVHDVGRKITTEDGRSAIISVLVDISKDVRMRDKLREEAAKDFLTGVYNRKGGELLISEKMTMGDPYMFFMMDLDNFKKINDFYGHEEGDRMLQFISSLLLDTFRKTDVVIRVGGDEFAVFAQPCSDVQAIQRKAEEVLHRYREKAREKFPLSQTSISMGGIYGRLTRDFAELYRLADDVLYEVKQNGKGYCEIRILN